MNKSGVKRSKKGTSLTELLMSVVLLGFSMAIIGELAIVSTMGTVRTTNKTDGLASARSAIDRISSDVRHARCFGDYYASAVERLTFPSSTNPLYTKTAPSGGWPAAPWQATPMTMSESCLILQIPVMFLDPSNDPSNSLYNPLSTENPRNGFPIMLPKNVSGELSDLENLDTVIYQVVPDPARSGEFLLQVARFPGAKINGLNTSYRGTINPPQTILKGLIGPKSNGAPVTELPRVFSYLGRTPIGKPADSNMMSKKNLSAATIPSVLGIGIDLEIKKAGLTTTNGDGRDPQFLGIHREAFMRANRNLILNNFGP